MKNFLLLLILISVQLFSSDYDSMDWDAEINKKKSIEDSSYDKNNFYIYYSNKLLIYNALGLSLSLDKVELRFEYELFNTFDKQNFALAIDSYFKRTKAYDVGVTISLTANKDFILFYNFGILYRSKLTTFFHIAGEVGVLVPRSLNNELDDNYVLPYIGLNLYFSLFSW